MAAFGKQKLLAASVLPLLAVISRSSLVASLTAGTVQYCGNVCVFSGVALGTLVFTLILGLIAYAGLRSQLVPSFSAQSFAHSLLFLSTAVLGVTFLFPDLVLLQAITFWGVLVSVGLVFLELVLSGKTD